MGSDLRIAIKVPAINTLDPANSGNVQGDESVARAWCKYLKHHSDVSSAIIVAANDNLMEGNLGSVGVDVVIHFWPFLSMEKGCKNILYYQNAFNDTPDFPGGTEGVFHAVKDRYDEIIFVSGGLRDAMQTDGPVIPFACDPEEHYPIKDTDWANPVTFIGNNIRGDDVNARYIWPAADYGLSIFGGPWPHPYSRHHKGKLTMDGLRRCYTNSTVNLNAHIPDHARYGTINSRIYEALACEGFIISDPNPAMEKEFGESIMVTTGGDDLRAKLQWATANGGEDSKRQRQDMALEGRQKVLAEHTYEKRMSNLVDWLKKVL